LTPCRVGSPEEGRRGREGRRRRKKKISEVK
jgi:hypothetical protein